ncbi:hypothetical protein J7E83_15855 [Arthrobacter sp. ISL-48]|nr:hypothetical protein [Arthrobacter sp. ISL-48]MBT2533568.1 hypothetical protein [Arthrobacter sp. ISL-48]
MKTSLRASGVALAYTGLGAGTGLLAAVGVTLIGVALPALVQRDGKVRP